MEIGGTSTDIPYYIGSKFLNIHLKAPCLAEVSTGI